MIAKSSISKNLQILVNLYNSNPSNQKGLLYSKLAILELCGWIEDTMDGIVRKCVIRRIKDPAIRERINEKVIEVTYGFHYNRHFRQMLVYVIGEISMLKIERNLDPKKFQGLQSTLGGLRKSRDIQAHTHLRGRNNKRLDSPLVTRANFDRVYDGLVDFERKLRDLGY